MRPLRLLVPLVLLALGLGLLASSPATAATPTLSVTPGKGQYVAGHGMLYVGNIGRTGVRSVYVQQHMNRDGDTWQTVKGFRSSTRSDGSFRFRLPSVSMRGISVRVVSGTLATPKRDLSPQQQDVYLYAQRGRDYLDDDQVVAGEPITLQIDAARAFYRRGEMTPPPPYAGRTLTVQKRTASGTWSTLGTTKERADGTATYVAPAVTTAGPAVYRVREEAITTGGHAIGWQASFPTYVQVLAGDPGGPVAPAAYVAHLVSGSTTPAPPSPTRTIGRLTAGVAYGWGAILQHFDWERGQSLSSLPESGTARKGRWLDSTLGSGRVAMYNGAMAIDTQRNFADVAGDFGTTRVKMDGAAARYGRWEVNMKTYSTDTDGLDYTVRIELVPALAKDYARGARNITMGVVKPKSTSITIAARSPYRNSTWRRTLTRQSVNNTTHRYAVEVSGSHISWFLDGKVIGTVKSANAVTDVPLTPRISVEGAAGYREMNRAHVFMDWVRTYPLSTGRYTTSGPALTRTGG